MTEQPSGTITFLFTDIQGSTRLWEVQPEAMSAALSRHDSILRDVIERNSGYVFKTIGDAFCSAFFSAENAVSAAVEAQRALDGEDWPEEVGDIRVRMALHTGVVEERGGDYYGQPVNRVARLLSAGHGGQVLVSERTNSLVGDSLPEQVRAIDLGERRLKDLTSPEHIFQLVITGLPAEFPPLDTLEGAPNNLPLQPTPFIGRAKEVAELEEVLARNEVRLLTLTGPGGIGKTRLALQVAADMLDQFPNGAFFVSLAPIDDPALVSNTVAEALGVRESGGQTLLASLKGYLQDKRILLVLDNYEHLLEAAPVAWELLRAAPHLKLLVTSRAPLRVSAEYEHHVPPLAVPSTAYQLAGRRPGSRKGHAADDFSNLNAFPAIALFVSRAKAANLTFELNEQNASAIAEICVRLDGIPLAIELAAARIKILTPDALLARLGNRLKLLTGGARDLPARQQTLNSTIEWSHDLLNAEEKTLFRRTSIFRGGFSLEALESVCGEVTGYGYRVLDSEDGSEKARPAPGDSYPLDVLDGAESLVDKSLMYRKEEDAGFLLGKGEMRFGMLDTIHEYAQARLEESSEAKEIARQHAGYFLQLAERAEPELMGPRQAEWLARMEHEHDNVRAALKWLHSSAEWEMEGRMAGLMTRFWQRRGYLGEGHRWLTAALEKKADLSPAVRAKALHGLGVMSYEQGDQGEAESCFSEALALRRELGDRTGMMASTNNLANVALYRDDYERAAEFYAEALALSREMNETWAIAFTLGNMGWIGMNQGDYERAASFYEEGLALRRASGDRWGTANSLDNLAWARTYQRNHEEASRLAEESMELFQEMGDKDGISDLLDIQGRAALGRGEYKQAKSLFGEGLTLNQEMGDKSGLALCLMGFAAVAVAQGEGGRAAVLFGAAETLRESTAPFQRVYFEPHLAEAQSQLDGQIWERKWQEGKGMSLEQAIEYAIEEGEESSKLLR
jgi:predicted ATPase/class 3 adenylate cyclase